jgi:hypothetical protein
MKLNKSLVACNLSLIVVVTALTAFGSAANANPSEADGKKVIEESLKSSCVKLDSFKKINAIERDEMGTKAYLMDYEASYSVAAEPCYGKYDEQSKTFNDPPSKRLSKYVPTPPLPVGKSFVVTKRQLYFVKKEKGWDGQIALKQF